MRRALASKHSHFSTVIHAHGVIAGLERENAIEVVAFDPELQLAGLIACVLADLEHRDNDDLDRDGVWGGNSGHNKEANRKEECERVVNQLCLEHR
jgi:hypothetical protein